LDSIIKLKLKRDAVSSAVGWILILIIIVTVTATILLVTQTSVDEKKKDIQADAISKILRSLMKI